MPSCNAKVEGRDRGRWGQGVEVGSEIEEQVMVRAEVEIEVGIKVDMYRSEKRSNCRG